MRTERPVEAAAMSAALMILLLVCAGLAPAPIGAAAPPPPMTPAQITQLGGQDLIGQGATLEMQAGQPARHVHARITPAGPVPVHQDQPVAGQA